MNSSTWELSKNKYSKSGLSRRKLVAAALAKSGRSVLLPVWMIRLGIFSVMNLSLFCSTIYRLKMAVRAKEWAPNLVCRLLLEKKKKRHDTLCRSQQREQNKWPHQRRRVHYPG